MVSESVPSNNDWFFPSRNESWNVINDDGFSEDSTVEDVSNGTVGTFPHMLEVEFLDSGFVRSDCGTFDSDLAFFDGICSIDGDLIVGCISVFDTEIEIFDIEIKEG